MTETQNCGAQRKPLMLIGPVGAGKSTLLKALEICEGAVKKTEAMIYMDQAIDTPGEMITIPHFYNALILNSVRARLILFLMDASRPCQLPSRLALALKAPVLGLISKIDLGTEDNLRKARAALTGAGVKNIIEISSLTGQGLDELNKWITGSPAEASAG